MILNIFQTAARNVKWIVPRTQRYSLELGSTGTKEGQLEVVPPVVSYNLTEK